MDGGGSSSTYGFAGGGGVGLFGQGNNGSKPTTATLSTLTVDIGKGGSGGEDGSDNNNSSMSNRGVFGSTAQRSVHEHPTTGQALALVVAQPTTVTAECLAVAVVAAALASAATPTSVKAAVAAELFGDTVERSPQQEPAMYLTHKESTMKTEAETLELAQAGLRLLRDEALRASDWTQMADSPLSTADKTAWANYRTYLRDLPANTDSDAGAFF